MQESLGLQTTGGASGNADVLSDVIISCKCSELASATCAHFYSQSVCQSVQKVQKLLGFHYALVIVMKDMHSVWDVTC